MSKSIFSRICGIHFRHCLQFPALSFGQIQQRKTGSLPRLQCHLWQVIHPANNSSRFHKPYTPCFAFARELFAGSGELCHLPSHLMHPIGSIIQVMEIALSPSKKCPAYAGHWYDNSSGIGLENCVSFLLSQLSMVVELVHLFLGVQAQFKKTLHFFKHPLTPPICYSSPFLGSIFIRSVRFKCERIVCTDISGPTEIYMFDNVHIPLCLPAFQQKICCSQYWPRQENNSHCSFSVFSLIRISASHPPSSFKLLFHCKWNDFVLIWFCFLP